MVDSSNSATDESPDDLCRQAMTRVIAGDTQAFRIVYETSVDEVHRFVARRVNHSDAEDLVADTFVRAFRAAKDWKDLGRPVIAWLLTIAKNVVRNHAAKTGRRAAKQPHLADERTQESQEDVVIDADDLARIVTSLEGLSTADQEILTLRFIDGMAAPKVGNLVGMSAGAVRTATYRALKTLRADFVLHGGVITL